MNCRKYTLSDEEATTVCAVYHRADAASTDLRTIIGGILLEEAQVKTIVECLARLDVALADTKPLVKELICLQGKEG